MKKRITFAHQYYGEYLMALGRFGESETQFKLAQELDPLSLHISSNLADLYYWMRKYDLAIESYKKILEINPNYSHAANGLAFAYEMKQDFDKAAAALGEILDFRG